MKPPSSVLGVQTGLQKFHYVSQFRVGDIVGVLFTINTSFKKKKKDTRISLHFLN